MTMMATMAVADQTKTTVPEPVAGGRDNDDEDGGGGGGGSSRARGDALAAKSGCCGGRGRGSNPSPLPRGAGDVDGCAGGRCSPPVGSKASSRLEGDGLETKRCCEGGDGSGCCSSEGEARAGDDEPDDGGGEEISQPEAGSGGSGSCRSEDGDGCRSSEAAKAQKPCCGSEKNSMTQAEKSCCKGSKGVQEPRCGSEKNSTTQTKKSCCNSGANARSTQNVPKVQGPCCGSGKDATTETKKSCCTDNEEVQEPCCGSEKNSSARAKKSCCNSGAGPKVQGPCCESEKKSTTQTVCLGSKCAVKCASPEAKSCCNDDGCSSKEFATKKPCCKGSTAQAGSKEIIPNVQEPCGGSEKSSTTQTVCLGSRCAVKCVSPETDSCCNDVPGGETICSSQDSKCCTKTYTCLAVVRSDEFAVDVFDARGRFRTFRPNAQQAKRLTPGKRLCFSTHGGGNGIDGMLTPCFDTNGEHDEPDEGCPCGEEGAHLHAHVYDPDACGQDDAVGCLRARGAAAATRKRASDWRFLSQITLYPDEDGTEGGQYTVPVTASAPKECNSTALRGHLRDRGLELSHWLSWRNEGRRHESCDDNEYCGESCQDHRRYPVRHGDHVDYLVHNETAGDLHMEHPCATCGENDIHGRFRLVHTRTWTVEGDGGARGGRGGPRINLHFFELHDEPLRLLDMLTGLFELESSRVHAVRAVTESTRIGRSSFYVKDICCASEVPQVESILGPIEGVKRVSVNPTTKTVYVDHDVDVVSVVDISSSLNTQGFSSAVKNDAAVAMEQFAGIPIDVFVTSQFDLRNASRDPCKTDEGEISDVVQACLEKKFSLKEVKNVAMNEKETIISIEHNPYYVTAQGIAVALDSFMFDVAILSDGGADGLWALKMMKEDSQDTIEHHSSSVRWTVILSGVLWAVSMLSLIGGKWEYLKYVALLSVAFGLPPIAVKAFSTLRRCRFDVNCMMLFAAVGALPLQEYTEAAAVTFLFAISEALEARATARARNALSAIVRLRPERANVLNPVTKDIVVLPASAVALGALVSVRTGDKIPCDGIVVEGTSTVDESSLTGESRPVKKSIGMSVSGGTINSGNCQLLIKTTATSNNSAVARLIRLVEEAQMNRSDTEKFVDAFAKLYTPVVVLAAFCMVTIPWAFGNEVGIFWAKNGLITIVIACPCALIISTPVVYVAGLAATAQMGVLVKGGQYLETLGRTKVIAFDKTGCLTQGVFAMIHFEVIGQKRPRNEVLGYLALMEAPASHPLSDAIVKGAANEQVEVPKLQLRNHTLLPGEGITANVEGTDVWVGNKRLFQRLDLYDELPEDVKLKTEEWAQSGGTVGFISIEGDGIIGAYCVADKIRDEAEAVVRELKRMGIEVKMLTGDQRPAAIGIGSQIGLEECDIISELLPQDKLAEIGVVVKENDMGKRCWRVSRRVMMVGDGVNDAPALALADVSVAMGEGAALAMETADITLLDSNLNKLLYILRMGRRVIRTIVENVAFSLIVKALVMGFTFAGKSSLWAAIASDVGAMLIVTLNGMKILPRRDLQK